MDRDPLGSNREDWMDLREHSILCTDDVRSMGSMSIGRRGLVGGNDHLLPFVGLPRVESMSTPVVNSSE